MTNISFLLGKYLSSRMAVSCDRCIFNSLNKNMYTTETKNNKGINNVISKRNTMQ